MTWKEVVARELEMGLAAEKAGNAGRARVCARRAAGAALGELAVRSTGSPTPGDALSRLGDLAAGTAVPPEVRDAALRLTTRVSPGFTSPSAQPLDDAALIVRYVSELLGGEPAES